ncbi:TonB-dependent receptor [Marinimicrobium sp. C6131]|uniref:TonB-dependent siderophore receptor n=1 Tax=Marinimicrobium sp. C6131 TaxID=3022676 RepID=UPI00223DF0B6|nr:TonB-dependent receptor [Marinimicrobium sp. C6131]UZJ44049.1 TonB-dependent receptor [Marinimicrobium sp. C6131]
MTTNTRFKYKELALVIGLGCGLASAGAIAQDEETEEESVDLGTYTTEGAVEDTMGLMPTEPVESVFGFGKTLLETPRGVTSVSASMMESFNITDIDDLVLIAPGSFTQSFFGVAGSLDVRGTPGEVYFRGVRRVNNPGNYPTPIGASDRIDVVRGPASPIYGPSKIGGYLNFEPKSARAETGQYLTEPTGELSVTRGSWDKNVLTAEVGGPASIGDKPMGYYIYAETENSGSYYDNSGTDQNIFQASFNLDVSADTRFEFGGMYHEYDGNQVAGWNRVTQGLVDNGTYITGTAQPVDTNGDGYNSPDEYDAWKATFVNPNNFFVPASSATDADMDPAWALEDSGTTQLEGNQVLVGPEDFLRTNVETLYFDIIHRISDNFTITNKTFYEGVDNLNENAYGFSAKFDTYAIENQTIFAFDAKHSDWLHGSYQISPSIRYTDFEHGEEFDYEYFDRRDLSQPIAGMDRMLLATMTDTDYSSYKVGDFTDYGLAFLADYDIGENLDVMLGARYDSIEFNTDVVTEKVRVVPGVTSASETEDGVSWTASVSYKMPFGVTPYVTVSEQATIIMGQGSEISPDLVASGDVLADSELNEVGLKGSFLDDRLYVSGAWFEQSRTNYSAQDLVSNNTTESEGYELEARFLVTDRFTMTAAVTHVEVTNLTALESSGSQFGFQGAEDMTGVTDPALFYGYVMQGLTLVGSEDEARKTGIPENMYSLTGAYEFGDGYRFTASAVHADSTYSGFSRGVELPSYTLLNAGLSYSNDSWSVSAQVKNLTDERYFRANFPDLFGSTIVLPELPRHYSVSLSYKF